MKKVYGLALAAALVAAATLPAGAIEPQEGTGGAPQKMPAQPSTELQQPAKPTGTQQRVSGTVSVIDTSKGSLALRSPDGVLKLHFPPHAIRDLKKGDTITAQYAFSKGNAPEGSVRAFDVPNGLGEHRMPGIVSKVDHEKGWLHVKSGEHTLELYFPPQMVRDLKTGDRITVDLAFSKTT
jgi:hypothetical protein